MDSYPSRQNPGVRESLDAVDAVRNLNAERLQRPRSYWLMVGAALAVLGLTPLARDVLPPLVAFVVPPLLMLAIVFVASRKQPSAVLNVRLRGLMWLPYIGGVLCAGVVALVGSVLYDSHGSWGIPVATAVVLFALCAVGGPALDVFWSRQTLQRGD